MRSAQSLTVASTSARTSIDTAERAITATYHYLRNGQSVVLNKNTLHSLLDKRHFETIRISDTQSICIPRPPTFHLSSPTPDLHKPLTAESLRVLETLCTIASNGGPKSTTQQLLCVNDPPTFYWKDDGAWCKYKPSLGVRIREVSTGDAIKSVEYLVDGREYRIKNVVYRVSEVAYGLQYVFERVRETRFKTILRKSSFGLLG
ncbi:hypothetical protein BJ741DRAFT_597662 [Chytriomyces cf. hyalinus JEL632]|nr:hypothetical protein BJ741DRAFT_597662 [Chytriomyces cf. hyalinus JEL632]